VAALLARDVSPDPARLTEAQRQLIRTSAGLVVLREHFDVRLIKGETNVSVGKYTRIANSLRRVLVTIGLQRHARDVTPPTLEEYQRQKGQVGKSQRLRKIPARRRLEAA